MAQRLIAAGDLAVEPKQAWTPGRRVRRRRRRRHQLRARRPRPGPRPRGARARRRARALLRDDRGLRVRAEPGPRRHDELPVPAADRGQARGGRRAASTSSTSASASRARSRRPSSRGRSSGRSRPSRCRPTRWPRGCPSCARRSPRGRARRFGAALDPTTRDHPDAGLQGGDLQPRPGLSPAAATGVVVTTPGYPVAARGALFAGAEVVELAARRPRAAGSPTSTPSTGTASRCCG